MIAYQNPQDNRAGVIGFQFQCHVLNAPCAQCTRVDYSSSMHYKTCRQSGNSWRNPLNRGRRRKRTNFAHQVFRLLTLVISRDGTHFPTKGRHDRRNRARQQPANSLSRMQRKERELKSLVLRPVIEFRSIMEILSRSFVPSCSVSCGWKALLKVMEGQEARFYFQECFRVSNQKEGVAVFDGISSPFATAD